MLPSAVGPCVLKSIKRLIAGSGCCVTESQPSGPSTVRAQSQLSGHSPGHCAGQMLMAHSRVVLAGVLVGFEL